MLSHIPARFVRRPARFALVAFLVLTLPGFASAAPSGQPATAGLPTGAVVRAALAAGRQQAVQQAVQQLPPLREATSRDGEIVKNLVFNSDAVADQGESQRQPYELSLLDAVELALRNNLSVQISRFGPESSYVSIDSSRAQFDPNLSFSIPSSFSRGSSPTTNQTQGGDVIVSQGMSGGFQWSERLEWGTNYNLSFTTNRSSNNNQFSTFNPSISSGFRGSITQPLLRGFGDVNRTGIVVAMNNYEGSLESFRASVQGVLFQVISAYWNLRAAAENLTISEDALDLANQQFERNTIQVEIGTLAPIETVQAETQAANAALRLLQSQNTLEDNQDTLKELLNFDVLVDDPFAYDLVPTEEPEVSTAPINAEQAVQIALDNDPTLAQQRLGLRNAELSLKQAKNNLLPSLSVTGSFNLSGRAGNRIIRSGGLGGTEQEIIESGFGTSIGQIFSGDFNSWSVGASLSFPLHNRAAKASATNSEISQRRAMMQFEQRQQQLSYDVRAQVRGVENLVQQVQQSTLSRELADRQMVAEQRKFEVGTSTNFQVLNFQNQLSQAQLSELQAILNLQRAIAQLELTKGTLLQAYGVALGDAGRGRDN